MAWFEAELERSAYGLPVEERDDEKHGGREGWIRLMKSKIWI